jgi:hypothetical protein
MSEKEKQQNNQQEETPPRLSVEILDKMINLAATGFGLVAALAWNDAIKLLLKKILGTQETLWAIFGYAILVTILVVLVTVQLSRLLRIAKQKEKEMAEHFEKIIDHK